MDPRFDKKLGLNIRNDTMVFLDDVDFGVRGIAPIKLSGEPENIRKRHISSFIAFFEEDIREGGYKLRNPKAAQVDIAIDVVTSANPVDPVRKMLEEAHRKWDGQRGRLERFFVDFLGVEDNDYHREAATIFLTGMVMRTMEPGCPFKHLLVLQSVEEDNGKSSVLDIMAGGHYKIIADSDILKSTKSMSEESRGPAIINFDEFTAFEGVSFEKANVAIEMSKADARVAFGLASEKYRMRHVPAATTNKLQMLESPNIDSGSRYVIIRIGDQYDRFNRFDFQAIKAIMPSLWAEAYQNYLDLRREKDETGQRGEPIYLKFSEEAEKYRMTLTRAARVESRASLLTDRIDTILTTPVGALGDAHVASWVRSRKNYMVHDEKVYRTAWFRPAIFEAITKEINDRGGSEDEIKMIRAEEAKTGKNSPFAKAIDELPYVEAVNVTRPIRGLEQFKHGRICKIDEKKLIIRLNEMKEIEKQEQEEEIPF